MRITLDSAVSDTFDNNELLKHFNSFNITPTQQNTNEIVAIVPETRHLIQEEILQEENFF